MHTAGDKNLGWTWQQGKGMHMQSFQGLQRTDQLHVKSNSEQCWHFYISAPNSHYTCKHADRPHIRTWWEA